MEPVVAAVDVAAELLAVDVLEAPAVDVEGDSVSDVVESPNPVLSSAEEVVPAGGTLPEGEKQCVQSVHRAASDE